jgi:hypothetical protein
LLQPREEQRVELLLAGGELARQLAVENEEELAEIVASRKRTIDLNRAAWISWPKRSAPPFALNGPQLGTADLSPGRRMQLTYDLPAGCTQS